MFVVDDDARVLSALSSLLSLEFAVKTFSSSVALLEAVCPYTPGCIVLELVLPDVSGLQLQAGAHPSSLPTTRDLSQRFRKRASERTGDARRCYGFH